MHNSAAVLVACALAATALTPPQRAVRRRTRLRARTAEGMAPGWKATTDETGAYELIPASYEYRYQEVYVEIPRTAESPGLGVLLEQFGTLDAENGGLTLVAGLVEGGNAANAGVDLLPGDSIVKAGTTRVECLDYDATVDALMALPPAPAPAGLMVKRLVKVPFVNIKVMFPREEGKEDVTFKMRRGASLRAAVWKSTSVSGAPDNSSLSHFLAMTRPSWLGRAARNRHRHAIEQASRRWRGGRRDDSARTRRKILISAQARGTAAEPRGDADVLRGHELPVQLRRAGAQGRRGPRAAVDAGGPDDQEGALLEVDLPGLRCARRGGRLGARHSRPARPRERHATKEPLRHRDVL